MEGARLCVDGCGRVWTGVWVWMEDGRERDWDGVEDGRWREGDWVRNWVWTGVWMGVE